MARTVEIIGQPVDTIPDITVLAAPTGEFEPMTGSSGKPQDNLQQAAEAIGRVNVSYEGIWRAVKEADGLWVIIRCNCARRALLLASAALQHRTQPHGVSRRGRIVCIRLLKDLQIPA